MGRGRVCRYSLPCSAEEYWTDANKCILSSFLAFPPLLLSHDWGQFMDSSFAQNIPVLGPYTFLCGEMHMESSFAAFLSTLSPNILQLSLFLSWKHFCSGPCTILNFHPYFVRIFILGHGCFAKKIFKQRKLTKMICLYSAPLSCILGTLISNYFMREHLCVRFTYLFEVMKYGLM